ncbi:DUF6074 family protein [Rhizobium halophytocola]|uniref:DUF982 domain-containing protein n=1 Tax=Rhizobium halophytocola TaxID=735519 RepID=A0ABS4E6F6_9HYPH|nr:DUF6074 family protein [Rhizobium halophytocola]MBP1853531.1 hypothetical protein [Rhizobium halophytocola]
MSFRESVATATVSRSVHFFPLHLRRDLVRQAAEDLDRYHGKAAADYWRSTCRGLAADLTAKGCSDDEMREQIMDFQAAVQVALLEMHREQLAQG